MTTPYRSADTHEGGGEEPSYAKLAARLKLSLTYAHPDQQALLDKLASGEVSSEECVLELQKEIVKRIGDKKQHELAAKQLDDEQQRAQQQQREQEETEMAQNAGLDEPVIIHADGDDDDESVPNSLGPEPTATAVPTPAPAPPTATGSSGSSQLNATPGSFEAGDGQPGVASEPADDPATEAQPTVGLSEAEEASNRFGQFGQYDELEERDENFMD